MSHEHEHSHFELRGHACCGEVELHHNLDQLPVPMQQAILGALDAHLRVRPLLKGTPSKSELHHPMHPEVGALIRKARRDWKRHGERLVERVVALLRERRVFSAAQRRALRELFADHRVSILAEIAGTTDEPARAQALVDQGVIRANYDKTGTIPAAYRLGRATKAASLPTRPTGDPKLGDVLRQAERVKLTTAEQAALGYVQDRSLEYIRAPVMKAQGRASRVVRREEMHGLRGALAEGLGKRKSIASIREDLTQAAVGTDLTNDMDVVARTEAHHAQVWGAFQALRQKAGSDDPLVYRLPNGRACKHCIRIYGLGRGAKPYRLSFVLQRTMAGGNYGLPASQWGPVAEATHPNCACSPWYLYEPDLADAVQDAADWIEANL